MKAVAKREKLQAGAAARSHAPDGRDAPPTDEELALRAQSGACGADEAFDELFYRYCPLTRSRAGAAVNEFYTYDDMLQEAMLGLFKAIRHYDPERGAPFSSFARRLVEQSIRDALNFSTRKKHRLLSEALSLQNDALGADILAGGRSTEDDLLDHLSRETETDDLEQRLRECLSQQEYQVVARRRKGMTYGAIAAELHLSKKQVDNALQRAKNKLAG